MKRRIVIEIEPASGTVDALRLARLVDAIERRGSTTPQTDLWHVTRTEVIEAAP